MRTSRTETRRRAVAPAALLTLPFSAPHRPQPGRPAGSARAARAARAADQPAPPPAESGSGAPRRPRRRAAAKACQRHHGRRRWRRPMPPGPARSAEDQGALSLDHVARHAARLRRCGAAAAAPSTSPALQDLARRLLFSNAVVAAGRDAARPAAASPRAARPSAGAGRCRGRAADDGPVAARSRPATGSTAPRIELHFAASDESGACNNVARC